MRSRSYLLSYLAPTLLLPLIIAGCSDATVAKIKRTEAGFAAAAAKVAELAPGYCKIRPQTSLDDLALAGVALATSEKAADAVKSAVDKVCSWVGEPKAS